MPHGSTQHTPPTNPPLPAAKQEPYKKAYLLPKSIEEFSGKSSEERTSRQKKIERVTGLGRRTREEIAKWNQMTALRFQTGGRHQTSPVSLRGASCINIVFDHKAQGSRQFFDLLFLSTSTNSLTSKLDISIHNHSNVGLIIVFIRLGHNSM